MGKRNKGNKKVSKGALKRQREQEKKLAEQKKKQQEEARAQAIARGEDPDAKAKAKALKEKEAQNSSDAFNLDMEEDDGPKEWTRDIMIHNFTLAPVDGGTPLIHKAELKLIHGHRYGLIGKNGAGKSTLLNRIVTKEFDNFPTHLRVHAVEQEMEGSDMTVLETVQAADVELTALLAEKEDIHAKLDLPEKLLLRDREAFTAEKREELTATQRQLELDLATLELDYESDAEKNDDELDKVSPIDVLQAKIAEIGDQIKALETVEPPMTDDRAAAVAAYEQIDPMRPAQVDERLAYLEADQAEWRASEVLDGLGFTDRMKNMKTSDLSGGWRMRVALASGLFIEPDVLLLDEPTNHLDFPTVTWLGEYLASYNPDKIVMVVSHERDFLNEVTTDICHLDRCKLIYFKGNYNQFVKTRTEQRRHQATQYKKQQREIAHQQDFIRRFAANKKWSTQAQSRRKVLAKMKRIEAVINDRNWRFTFPEPEKLRNNMVLDIEDMGFSYFDGTQEDKYLLKQINARIMMGKKIGMIGANGAGKSTMLKLIMSELVPLMGKCFMRNEVTFGYFAQHHLETIDMDATPLQFLRHEFPSTPLQDCFQKLGRFNITPKQAQKKIVNLSGGEKSRLAFCLLTWYNPQLVIMDEPTNHLDIQTQDALVHALSDFKGSLLIVSHDKHLLTSTCEEFWVIGNQTLTSFDNFDKATQFCYKKCRPVDVLPREFSTVESKQNKQISKRAKDSNPANILAGDAKKDQVNTQTLSFEVDVEREIEKGIEKGLTPDRILMHIKEFEPTDGDKSAIYKLGFDMFNKIFTDAEYADIDVFEFYESYIKIINFLLPPDHLKTQVAFLQIAQSVWFTSMQDGYERADEESLVEMFDCFYNFQYITDAALIQWQNMTDDNTVGREVAFPLLNEWIAELDIQLEDAEQEEELEGQTENGDAQETAI